MHLSQDQIALCGEEQTMNYDHFAESFKFADIVGLWARERLVHEVVVGRELVKGVVTQGLRLQSADPRWVKSSEPFRGYPFVGYAARHDQKPVLLRASALEHLLFVARTHSDPALEQLSEEFVTKSDFRQWLIHSGKSLPAFWFSEHERPAAAPP